MMRHGRSYVDKLSPLATMIRRHETPVPEAKTIRTRSGQTSQRLRELLEMLPTSPLLSVHQKAYVSVVRTSRQSPVAARSR